MPLLLCCVVLCCVVCLFVSWCGGIHLITCGGLGLVAPMCDLEHLDLASQGAERLHPFTRGVDPLLPFLVADPFVYSLVMFSLGIYLYGFTFTQNSPLLFSVMLFPSGP